MAIIIDKLRDHGREGRLAGEWCHMAADTGVEELHAFAARLGLWRAWFQGDHYDLRPQTRAAAVELGAQEVDDRTFLSRMHGPRGDRARRRAAARRGAQPSSPGRDEGSRGVASFS